jgi:hypothetical protein
VSLSPSHHLCLGELFLGENVGLVDGGGGGGLLGL